MVSMQLHVSNSLSEAKSQTVGIYERLRADILAGRLAPAQRLKTGALCDHLGVSLGVVREALSRLAAEGLVNAEPQRGFQVAPISTDDLLDLTIARVELEGTCLRRSIANGDLSWESQLVAAFHQLSGTPDYLDDDGTMTADWINAHARFHEALVAACGSAWLMRLRRTLYEQAERYRQLSAAKLRKRHIGAEHKDIFEATLERDADKAVQLLSRHIETTTESLIGHPVRIGAR